MTRPPRAPTEVQQIPAVSGDAPTQPQEAVEAMRPAPAAHPAPAANAALEPRPRANAAGPVPGAASPVKKSATVVDVAVSALSQQIRGVLVEFTSAADGGRLHALYEGRNLLGRGPECSIRIDDPRVSNQHAFVYLDGTGARVVDISVNGTLVAGQRVLGSTQALAPGARLELGGVRLVYLAVPNPYEP